MEDEDVRKEKVECFSEEEANREHERLKREYEGLMVVKRDYSKGDKKHFVIYVYNYGFNKKFTDFRILTENEISYMLNNCDNNSEVLLIYLLLCSGRRISEVVGKHGIRPVDIHEEKSLIDFKILKKKGKKERFSIYIPQFLIKMLKNYVKMNKIEEDSVIFPKNRHWGYHVIKKCSKGISENRSIYPHLFRHTYCANLAENAENPADVVEIQNQMQHSNTETTYHYIRRFNKKRTRELVNKSFDKFDNSQ